MMRRFERPFLATRAALVALFLSTVARAVPAQQVAPVDTSIRLHRHVATERGYDANAWWIETPTGLVLIDALLTRSDSRALVASMQSTGKPLAAVFLTHPHADHFGGLSTVHAAYPTVPIVATKATIEGIHREHDKGIANGWLAAYGADYDRKVYLPDRVIASGDSLLAAGLWFIVRDYGALEAENNSVIHVPAMRALFTGDATVSGASVYVGEGHARRALEILPRLVAEHPTVERAYSGHYGAQSLRVVIEDNLAQLRLQLAAASLVLSDSSARDSSGRVRPAAQSALARALAMHALSRQHYGVGAAAMAALNFNGLASEHRAHGAADSVPAVTAATQRAMRRLLFLIGRWPDAEFRLGLGGLYVDGSAIASGYRYEFMLSFDQAQRQYRMISRDHVSGLVDVYEGDFDAAGRLVVSNVRSGTHYRAREGAAVHTRLTFAPQGDASWSWTIENGSGSGDWSVVAEHRMTRKRIE